MSGECHFTLSQPENGDSGNATALLAKTNNAVKVIIFIFIAALVRHVLFLNPFFKPLLFFLFLFHLAIQVVETALKQNFNVFIQGFAS